MTIQVFFGADPEEWDSYHQELKAALAEAGLDARLTNGNVAPEAVDYIVFSPGGVITDFTPYTRAKAVLNLWAGVEKIVGNITLTQPLARMVDPAMTESMVEWVVGHTLRHHLGMDRHIHGQDGVWRNDTIGSKMEMRPIARERMVTILGLGELGQAAAQALVALNFPVRGWSRTPREVPGVECFSGDAGIDDALRGAEIVILLMPYTPATENTLNAARLALLAPGAVILNPGRGQLIDDAALLAALDSGHVGQATLDVFRVEPLPPEHPYWAHPSVTVTPHIAAQTRPRTASRVIVENIRRSEAGQPLLHLVDRKRGY
ncbi:MAG: glyoxylate/hydroxypyruvate reductase A [Cereibacter sphaeroides]|uniref:Glyoxylate/hydroxypyruvate reductase A n=1 Tax=Cereibacter sphaeroides TaxID=1063 RepID=A0A2W5SDR0_CERSP|nr:MAG: glyoxylate/hydroxypyruvate reductase A [Cereibacter sphaeroides]